MIEIREALLEDLPEITLLFRDTIQAVNSKDYSEKQIIAWSSGAEDIEKWQKRINKDYFLIAEINGLIVGFAWLKNGNYLEGMYVHKDFQRKTIGSKLLRVIESRVSLNDFDSIKSESSKTALEFFDSHFYEVEKKQKKSFKGMEFENYIVYREL